MDARQEAALRNHLNSLSPQERANWKGAAEYAVQNEHDENHHSWEKIRQIGRWLGITSAGGLTFFTLKKLARAIMRH